MREIKFRAWDKKRQWMTDVYIYNLHPYSEDIILKYPKIKNETYVALLEDVEIMQYTGLKDKNGKEIYEGDIVKYTLIEKPEIQVITYNEKYACYEWGNIPIVDLRHNDNNEYEVIGNIYENPELLEVNK